jgi:Na+-translocating ferredoxin:NAD+ oxidoreductase subunit G
MLKDILRLGLILFAISAIATGILAWVNSVTYPTIARLKIEDAIKTRQELMPTAKTFEEKKAVADTNFVYYVAKDAEGSVLGYALTAVKHGYSSDVHTMVTLDGKFAITNLKVIDQNETPGLGTHCQDKDFPARFLGISLENLRVDKDGGAIKSLTGATITTRAITNSLREAILLVQTDQEAAIQGGGK